jgi:hypothetical protein
VSQDLDEAEGLMKDMEKSSRWKVMPEDSYILYPDTSVLVLLLEITTALFCYKFSSKPAGFLRRRQAVPINLKLLNNSGVWNETDRKFFLIR